MVLRDDGPEHSGIHAARFLRPYRIEKAKELLLSGEASRDNMCEKAGFSDGEWFRNCSREETGMGAAEYPEREQHRLGILRGTDRNAQRNVGIPYVNLNNALKKSRNINDECCFAQEKRLYWPYEMQAAQKGKAAS